MRFAEELLFSCELFVFLKNMLNLHSIFIENRKCNFVFSMKITSITLLFQVYVQPYLSVIQRNRR